MVVVGMVSTVEEANGLSSSTVPTSCRGSVVATAARWTSSDRSSHRGSTRASLSSPASRHLPGRRPCRTGDGLLLKTQSTADLLAAFVRWRTVASTSRRKSPRSCPRRHRCGDRWRQAQSGPGVVVAPRTRDLSSRPSKDTPPPRSRAGLHQPEDGRNPPNQHQPQLAVRTAADLVDSRGARSRALRPAPPQPTRCRTSPRFEHGCRLARPGLLPPVRRGTAARADGAAALSTRRCRSSTAAGWTRDRRRWSRT